MSRYLPVFLVPLLACAGPAWGDDANKTLPPLESRVGQTVTVVEAKRPTDKAVITLVWRLQDGTPVMQAKSLTTGGQLTMVENPKATTAADRIKVYHWSKDGVAPAGCPTPPVAKTTVAPKAIATAPTAMAKPVKVATTEGGLLPVLTKKEEPKPITTVAMTKPAPEAPVVTTPAPATTTVTKTAPATVKTVQTTVAAQPVTMSAAPVAVARPQLVGGCEVITISENGKPRQFKVVGTARDRDGVMVQRCEALDTGEIVNLSCGNCCTPAACAAPCAPAPCAPVVVKPAPCPPDACAPKCETVKPCPPAKVVCEPVKTCAPCPKVCDNCAGPACGKACDQACVKCQDACHRCGGKGCEDCRRHHQGLLDNCHHEHEHVMKNMTLINVPVPGVLLNTPGGLPSGPPPQPLVPSFCTANSSSVRAAICGPVLIPMHCVGLPFSPCMRANLMTGIGLAQDTVEAEAIKNTLVLMNVLQTSREWENRQWAAERLMQATLPSMKPYVEDCLLAAAQYDRAPYVKATALRTLVQLSPQRPDLMGLLAQSMRDSDPTVQQAAAQGMECLMKAAGVQQAAYQK